MQIATDDEVREIETLAMSRGAMHWATLLKTINRLRKAEAALSLPVQPVADAAPWGWANENGAVTRFYPDKWISLGQKLTPLYTTPPVPPTKGPEDDLIAAREAVSAIYSENGEWMAAECVLEGAYHAKTPVDIAVQSALLALRSRPASALPGVGEPAAWADVIAERKRQVEKEGWTPEHDDAHSAGQMAYAASAYARPDRLNDAPPSYWPWEREWWKPGDRRADLVKAGALILAEIERLDRASALPPSVQP